MSSFKVSVERLKIEPHENADALEIACIGAYKSIVRKGDFVTGQLAVYIPEQSILPQPLLEEMGLTGKLAGKDCNRVKAIKLRGVLSQGLCYKAHPDWPEGHDVQELLGITKYEPVVPSSMSGAVYSAGLERCMRYDIENFKRYPDILQPDEPVVFTEKLHGTWAQIALMPSALAHPEHGPLVVSSKGFASKGLAFIPNAPENAANLYLRVAQQIETESRIRNAFPDAQEPIFILGEIFGQGVQDLSYGAGKNTPAKDIRVFDIYVGIPGHGHYLDDTALDQACARLGLSRVPILYRGPFNTDIMLQHTNGHETISGQKTHMREGIVIKPCTERTHPELGRVQLKSVSEAYLLRKGGTEYN
jgi:RNA ligase (TIGR02306 family)